MGGKARPDNSQMIAFQQQQAAEARQKEAERQARLEQGKSAIDAIFAGGNFDQPFYDKYGNALRTYNSQQLEDQYAKQREQATYKLADAGLLRSTIYGDVMGDIDSQYFTNKAALAAKADEAVGQLRENILGQQQSAIQQLYSTEDPTVAANTARNMVANIPATPNLNPLGELFRPLVIGGVGAASGAIDQYNRDRILASSPATGYGALGGYQG